MKQLRKNALLIAAALCSLASTATNRVYVKDFAIAPGETKIVEIYVESDAEIRSFQADVVLPDGLTLDKEKIAFSKRSNEHIVYADSTARNTYTIIAFSLNNAAFNGTDGTMLEVPITADAHFKHSDIISVNDITIEATDRTQLAKDGKQQCNVFITLPPLQAPESPEEPENPEEPVDPSTPGTDE